MRNGQALVMLLIFITMAITVTTAGVILTINNSQASSGFEQSAIARDIAESGAENALIRMLRDPSYAGETLTMGTGTATITVTGSDPKTVNSVGRLGNFMRTIQVTAQYLNGVLTVTAWREIF